MTNPFGPVGRMLIIAGLLLVLLGGLLQFGEKIFQRGRLPGDILIRRGNFTFYFPLGTCVLLSIILSLVLALLNRR
ncbi:MAG TPA: DUF2905 domain-containing protein [Firmicutes bacterium]|uniref:DUF2905 domain-containing protein n=1 Tax=Capillibacterium thermochitinicola TaxID=2699427 RepID=A0A8J6I1L0_9FIRM|nr:DUF2905 domain-containing protein [Capillibacterium thermochitinicola]MBA2133313.1 DUF2905 domain-containing protein [Capillibacterium thermochitinicola]HHW12261.1 DUF2905 domain-containing protein [Bacillota bacterium]